LPIPWGVSRRNSGMVFEIESAHGVMGFQKSLYLMGPT
jgi:hypothetical protein